MITARSCVRVEAKYCPSRIPEYQNCPTILALGEIIKEKDLFDRFIRAPAYNKKERQLSAEERYQLLPRLNGFVYPLDDTFSAFRKLTVMIRRGYLDRNPLDSSFDQKLKTLDELPENLRQIDFTTKPLNNSLNGLITGEAGVGKSTIIELFDETLPRGVLKHGKFRGKEVNRLQIPTLVRECDPKGSLNGLLEDILTELGRLAGEPNLLADCPKRTKAGKPTLHELIPYTVRQLVLFNVGMLIIDEAEFITAQFNNGDAAMVFVWINLMNISGVPLLLVANPEFEDVIRLWLKASMRFSAGCRMKIRPLPRGQEFDDFTDALNEYQWTRTKTVLTEEIRNEFYTQTQGILRYMLDVWRWTHELTISRGGKEQITARLMQEAVEKNGHEVREIIADMRSRDVKLLEKYRDLRGVLPPVHASTTPPPPPPKKPEKKEFAAKGETKTPKPRRGKEPCTGYMDVDRVAVRGEYSRHAFIKEYFQIPDSKELYLS